MNKIKTSKYERITKKEAKRRYNTGLNVFLSPVKIHPESLWMPAAKVSLRCSDPVPFETIINEFIHYNCYLSEVGLYPAYYKEL